ncbi:MAG TPA: hypothetical protein VMF50_08670 [Candidatus Binataceae bacterium]|nr:hypothetical protein [Candidatus Binataceae bacterium]
MEADKIKQSAANALGSAADAAADAIDSAQAAKQHARKAASESYDQAREYVGRGIDYVGGFSENLADFVSREPWIAIAGAFVVGYLSAQMMRRVSR